MWIWYPLQSSLLTPRTCFKGSRTWKLTTPRNMKYLKYNKLSRFPTFPGCLRHPGLWKWLQLQVTWQWQQVFHGALLASAICHPQFTAPISLSTEKLLLQVSQNCISPRTLSQLTPCIIPPIYKIWIWPKQSSILS